MPEMFDIVCKKLILEDEKADTIYNYTIYSTNVINLFPKQN